MKYYTKRILSILFACILLVGIVACKQQELPEQMIETDRQTETQVKPEPETATEEVYVPDGDMISAAELAEALREKYSDTTTVAHQESLWNVPQDQEFYMDFEFDLMEDTDYTQYTEIFAVFADAELTEPISGSWEIITHEKDPTIPEGHNRLYARPGRNASGRVWGSYHDIITSQLIHLDESGDYYLHEQDEFSSWGFLKHYYLAQLVDPITAETLETPIVTIFTVGSPLEAPHSEFYVTEDGKAAFRWNEVEGADYYLIIAIDSSISPIDKATGTSWEYPLRDDHSTMNSRFVGLFIITDDDLLAWSDDDYVSGEPSYKNYSVIAVNSETHSPLGTIHRGEDMALQLPYRVAYNTNRQEMDGNTRFIPSVSLLPTHLAISMADGSTVFRRLVYDFSFVQIKEDEYLHYDGLDENGNFINPRLVNHTNLHINYIIEGTVFTGIMTVENVDENTAMTELESFRKMMGESVPQGGNTETTVESAPKKKDSPTSEDAPDLILDTRSDRIFANSALSEFLAINLIGANDMIDLSGFPESADWEHLLDAFFEAMYQNPLVLHIENAASIPGTNLLIVNYRESQKTIHEQQAKLREIVPEIAAKIIDPGMTDIEKSFAINAYLIENSEYDFTALQNAESNNFQFVDASFNDSFTAYGILINKVGVCAGYADAFKLLADEAGLESIIVTGYLEGVLPHAWNRVNIDDQWHTVDVTNNANEFLFNAFLNLPDSAAGRLLVEDNQFMMSAYISEYRSTDGSNEYYTVKELFFDIDKIAAQLAEAIRRDGTATLRTNYDLNNEAFYEIAIEVIEILGVKELYGFTMLGVIWMSLS